MKHRLKWHKISESKHTATNERGVDYTIFRDTSVSGPWAMIVGRKFLGGFSSVAAAKKYATKYRGGIENTGKRRKPRRLTQSGAPH